MSEQDGTQVSQPTKNDDKEAWKGYWKAEGQPWRTEPEIDVERQKYLDERRSIKPDIEQDIYPFKNIKLSRADVEWLLATHENGCGPVDWSDESQRERVGLDLRGADLCHMDLHILPLARLRGGLFLEEWQNTTKEQRFNSGVRMQGANLAGAQMQGAILRRAQLQEAWLKEAQLQEAVLRRAQLQEADLSSAQLQSADFGWVQLQGAYLGGVALVDKMGISPRIDDVQWDGVNLSVVDWSQVRMLGDEYRARQRKRDETMKDEAPRLDEYKRAVRANRQLAVALQSQGLNEDAARFNYHAQLLQRKVFWYQRKYGQYLFSIFLDLLAGYGYKPWRSFLAYLIVITAFATAYFTIGHTVGPSLSPLGSFVFSMTSFHGRGFFPGGIGLDDPLTVLAAIEAFVGLLIEVTFIASLTQRLFGK